MLRHFLFIALLSLGAISPAYADASRNVALIIANGGYTTQGGLANPAGDGKLVAASLKKAGFDTVMLATDLDRPGFEKALRDFRGKVSGAHVAMVYYAGHGIESEGRNWLLPVDVKLASGDDLPYEAVDLNLVMEALKGAQVRMVILDACRNNPFASGWRASNRAMTRGLARVEADDFLVIYAAAPGQTASDGTGSNSPFAQSLAARIEQPGLAIQMLGGLVRDDVMAATAGKQRPFVSASITGTPVYLFNRSPQLANLKDVPIEEVLGWQSALNLNTREGYETYLTQFPKGKFVKLAKQNVKLAGKRAAIVPVASTAPSPAATAGAAFTTMPGGAAPEENGAVAALNMGLLTKYQAQERQALEAHQDYTRKVAEVAAKKQQDQDEYQANLRAYAEEQSRWKRRAEACEKLDAKRCAAVAKELEKPTASTTVAAGK